MLNFVHNPINSTRINLIIARSNRTENASINIKSTLKIIHETATIFKTELRKLGNRSLEMDVF